MKESSEKESPQSGNEHVSEMKEMTGTHGVEGITTVPLNSYVSDSMRGNAGFLT